MLGKHTIAKLNRVFGWVSLLLRILTILTIVLTLQGGIGTIFVVFIWLYSFYKTIIKKQILTKVEWSAIAILVFIGYILPFILL